MEETIVFTRYLYLKDEVKIALLSCILEKKEDAIFWGYELYYSGFPEEFFKYMWKIYYDYFATLNPSFEMYFMKNIFFETIAIHQPIHDIMLFFINANFIPIKKPQYLIMCFY